MRCSLNLGPDLEVHSRHEGPRLHPTLNDSCKNQDFCATLAAPSLQHLPWRRGQVHVTPECPCRPLHRHGSAEFVHGEGGYFPRPLADVVVESGLDGQEGMAAEHIQPVSRPEKGLLAQAWNGILGGTDQ